MCIKTEYLTPVKCQGFYNSCIAYALIAVVESYLKKDNKKNIQLSEKDLFTNSPGYSYKKIPGVHNYFTGWNMQEALYYFKNNGVKVKKSYKIVKIKGYKEINGIENIKKWIINNGPLVSVMDYYSDFIFYRNGVYSHKHGKRVGKHAITIVGYDDNKKAWLCKNSWSKLWGIRGYCWFSYNSCEINIKTWGITGYTTN